MACKLQAYDDAQPSMTRIEKCVRKHCKAQTRKLRSMFGRMFGKGRPKIELVVARYNEDLHWLKQSPFSNYSVVCYNKGPNDAFYHSPKMKTVHVKNVGRCDHTYLYHIVKNYDQLAEITLFLPGSVNMPHKMKKALQQIQEVEKHKTTVFLGRHYPEGVFEKCKDFQLDHWVASDKTNQQINQESHLKKANPRPFGRWYQKHFQDLHVEYISHFGILGISRDHIVQHPKSYYETLLKELDNDSNPEVGHYFERAWAAVFSPLKGAKMIPFKD